MTPTASSQGTAPRSRSESVLLVDDDADIRRAIGKFLGTLGYAVLLEETAAGAVATFQEERPDVVLLDVGLPDQSGLDALEDLCEDGAIVVLLTGHADVSTAVTAMQRGAENFLTKPVDLNHLAVALARAMEKARLRREVRLLRGRSEVATLEGALGVSPAMQALEREIAIVGESPRTTVLITGDSGTGKGYVARLIHQHSPRADGPFVAINCAGLTASLLNDELFGHERGAFTDAKERKQGLFEVADGGTVFLDEIGELTADLQPKLLTVIETRRFRRLGGTREITTDIRLLSATSRDLEQAMEHGTFREDLYYRIAVTVIHLPPVRERTREDRLHLLKVVLAELSAELPGSPPELAGAALERLLTYSWPGNVREMHNALERAMIMSRGSVRIGLEHLPSDLKRRGKHPRGQRPASLEDTERNQVARALKHHGGNRTHAAKDLGISRVTLLKKIKKYQL